MASLKRKRLSLTRKYQAIAQVESGTKPSNVTKKYVVHRNTISGKGKNLRVGENRMRMNNLLISGTILKE